jgi:hypothetical protein
MTDQTEKHVCCETVRGEKTGWRYSYHACSRRATFERNGKWYCGTHDPEKIAAKSKMRESKWKADFAAERARRAFVSACESAIRAIASGYNDPVTLAREVIAKEFEEPKL